MSFRVGRDEEIEHLCSKSIELNYSEHGLLEVVVLLYSFSLFIILDLLFNTFKHQPLQINEFPLGKKGGGTNSGEPACRAKTTASLLDISLENTRMPASGDRN